MKKKNRKIALMIALCILGGCNQERVPQSESFQSNGSSSETKEILNNENTAIETSISSDDPSESEDSNPITVSNAPADTEEITTTAVNRADQLLQTIVERLECVESIDRFRGNTSVSQSEMTTEEIARLLTDQNIVCFYTFQIVDTLVYDHGNYSDEQNTH